MIYKLGELPWLDYYGNSENNNDNNHLMKILKVESMIKNIKKWKAH